MAQHLHIISFDVPYPPNYGGVMDVFYKLVWLKERGVKVHLHCFAYGRAQSTELAALCEQVSYYPRKTGWRAALSLLPYTVSSRRSRTLEEHLLKDDHPILFEVLHTCYLLGDRRFAGRKKIYRHSNVEHRYYRQLASSERSLFKKAYLLIESVRLARFEKILKFADSILAVNRADRDYFARRFPGVRSVFIPSFHPNVSVTSRQGRGSYALFHGNLSISENYEALAWLVDNVFRDRDYEVIVAGLRPPPFLRSMLQAASITLIADPSDAEMEALVHDAQVHALFTHQPTGLKLKLLNVLFRGRFVVCNAHLLSGTGLQANNGLRVAGDPGEFRRAVRDALSRDFGEDDIRERVALVGPFTNQANIALLLNEI